MRKPVFMFESWRGRYADSPRSVSEELAVRWPGTRRIWVSNDQTTEFPSDVTTVRRHRAGYFRRLLTADVLMANDIISRHLVKGPRVTYVQMWHGTPLKLIGHDEKAHAYSGATAHLKRMVRDVEKWDYLVSPSPVCSRLFRTAFHYEGPIWETGYPRNDVLRSSRADDIRRRVRQRLGIAADERAVLYAPTWRDDDKNDAGQFQQSVMPDLATLRGTLPERSRLLLRLHKNVTGAGSSLLAGLGRFALDVSSHQEIAELYLAADVLVSDYSSAVFDYAVTGKPIVLFAPDLDRYRDATRGLYFDYESWAPGPVAATTEELAALLGDVEAQHRKHAEAYASFVERFCPHEDGGASARVVDLLRSALDR
jgi:CDP-glycerol glycerophosphotransferase